VTHLVAVDDVGHLHARFQFVALHVHRKDADVAGLHVVGDLGWQVGQGTRRQVLQHEGLEGRSQLQQLLRDAGGDVAAGVVSDEGNLLARLNAQASVDRVAGARREFGIERGLGEIGENGLNQEMSFHTMVIACSGCQYHEIVITSSLQAARDLLFASASRSLVGLKASS